MTRLVRPHGGDELKPLMLKGEALAEAKHRAAEFARVPLSWRETGDLIMMGIGGLTPLDGSMTRSEWQGVCDEMVMSIGLFWPIPITLSTQAQIADAINEGDNIALVDSGSDEPMPTASSTISPKMHWKQNRSRSTGRFGVTRMVIWLQC